MKQTSRSFQLLRKTPPSAQNLPSLVVSSAGTHGKIQLNRPEALNAVNNDMINEIRRGLNRKKLKFDTIFSSEILSKTNESYALKDFESSKSIASVSIGSIHGKKASFCAGGDILGWFSKNFKILNLVGSHVRPIRKQLWANLN